MELLTALLYLGIALKFWHQLPVMLAFWVLISLFVAAAFIDAEHQIIPTKSPSAARSPGWSPARWCRS
ncbi:MAG: hypothetical protein R3F11_12765 [Verrucomicrobiales bacterium]